MRNTRSNLPKGHVITARGKVLNFEELRDRATGKILKTPVKQEFSEIKAKPIPVKKPLNVKGHKPTMITEEQILENRAKPQPSPVVTCPPPEPKKSTQSDFTSVKVTDNKNVTKKGIEGANEIAEKLLKSLSASTKDISGFKNEEIV